ncbi:hypothetical protein AB0D80_15940 [Streptomyces tendae]|uniref:hypothetical protein n=1 Tax=Streptomyces tendae TaxID=1932 RepID=UPI0033D308C3
MTGQGANWYETRRLAGAGDLAPTPRELTVDRVRDVLRHYDRSCTPLIKESA